LTFDKTTSQTQVILVVALEIPAFFLNKVACFEADKFWF